MVDHITCPPRGSYNFSQFCLSKLSWVQLRVMTHYSEQWKITQNKNSPPFIINSNRERERERSEEKSKSKTVGKPLRDVSNNKNKNNKYNNGGRFSKPLDMKNLSFSEKEDWCKEVEEEEEEKDGLLNCLLLVQSDLFSLIHQVTTISLLTICLFLEKMILKTRIVSCSM